MSLDGYWTLEVEGLIDRIEVDDVDKTRRNPKLMLDIYVAPGKIARPDGDAVLPNPVPFRILERELKALSAETFAPGDAVVLRGRGNGRNPRFFGLQAISRQPR